MAAALALALPSRGVAGIDAPGDASADAPDDTTDPAASEQAEAPIDEAQAKYAEGRAKFETADYAGAIDLWTIAYAKVPDTPDAARIKALLLYNIATARERVFDVTRDPSQLRQAKILLEEFMPRLPQLYTEAELATETERVEQRIADLQARIEEAERDDTPAGDADPPATTTPAGPTDSPSDAGRGLVIGGAVALGVGVAGLGVMGAGLGLGSGANDISGLADDDITGRRDQFARGRTGNTLAIAGAAVGAVGVITGAVLLGLGLKRKRSVAVTGGPGLVGLGVRGRF